jgi:nucleoside-diphosphate-sugar epimerase
MNSTFKGPINVATGKSTSLAQILELFEIHHPELLVDSDVPDEKEIKDYSQGALNVLLAQKTFDWSSKVSIEDGIREILADHR